MWYLFWIDTRDMGADGMTKGAVSRTLIHEFMAGTMRLRFPFEHWHCKMRPDMTDHLIRTGTRVGEGNRRPLDFLCDAYSSCLEVIDGL